MSTKKLNVNRYDKTQSENFQQFIKNVFDLYFTP